MYVLLGHCMYERCFCLWHVLGAAAAFFLGNMRFPAPVSSKSLSPAPLNTMAGTYPDPVAVDREIGDLLFAFFPQNTSGLMVHCGRENCSGLKEGGVSRDRNSRSSLGLMLGSFPNKELASLLPASELLQVVVSPRHPCTALPSVRSGHGVIA